MGRVATLAPYRGTGLGKALVAQGIARAEHHYPGTGLRISAQQYLIHFYQHFGFVTEGEPYDEDGIAHIEMRLAPI